MTKWEYDTGYVVTHQTTYSPDDTCYRYPNRTENHNLSLLNEMGQKGWELVGLIKDDDGDTLGIFKRPMTKEAEESLKDEGLSKHPLPGLGGGVVTRSPHLK